MIDFKHGKGQVYFEKRDDLHPDCTVEMSDETLKKSVAGELNVFNALWNHDFSVSGSLMKALKFNTVVVPAYNEYKEKQK